MWDLWWTNWHWAGFLWVRRFLLPSTPPIAPHLSSSIIIQGWYNRLVVSSVIVDWVQLHTRKWEKHIFTIWFAYYLKSSCDEMKSSLLMNDSPIDLLLPWNGISVDHHDDDLQGEICAVMLC
jgi:hypothetical protein